jgi:adenine deaminase
MMKFSQKNKIEIPFKNEKEIQESYENLTNLNDFLKLYYQGTKVLTTEDDFYELTFQYLGTCFKNNVKHIEPFFDPQSHTKRGIKFEIILNGIYNALIEGEKKYKISFRLIMCILRDDSLEEGLLTLKESLKYKDKIFGIGLDSDEINHPPSKFKKLFEIAKREGFKLCAHGGHDGPAVPYVSELFELDLDRIDHGVTSIEDEGIKNELVNRGIPLTVCPISNVKVWFIFILFSDWTFQRYEISSNQ